MSNSQKITLVVFDAVIALVTACIFSGITMIPMVFGVVEDPRIPVTAFVIVLFLTWGGLLAMQGAWEGRLP